ncbi:MAG: formyltransferase family protein [Patescibacteria group bacterium]
MNNLNKIDKIILFNLDSFVSSKGIKKLIDELHDKIILICASKRFGGKYGSFLKQLKKSLSKSGLDFVMYQSLNLIYYKIAIFIFDIINRIIGQPKKIYSLGQLAKKYSIPLIKAVEINDEGVISLIKNNNPGLIISFYFDQVIRQKIISIPKYDVINVHTAVLPKCKGPFPILCSMLNDIEGGITIHSIDDETLDNGAIYKQKSYNLDKTKSIMTLDSESMIDGADILIHLLKEIKNNNINKATQEEEGFYMPFPTKKDIETLKQKNIKLFNIKEFIKAF